MGSDERKPDLCPVQHSVGSDLHKNLVLMQSTFAELNRKEVTFAALANSVSYRLSARPFASVPDWSLGSFGDLPTSLAFNNFARDY